jgi:hypothetical protein
VPYIRTVAKLTGIAPGNANIMDGGTGADWFDPVGFLGKRGTKLLPRGAQLTAACSTLLRGVDGLGYVNSNRRGIWVATSTFAETMHETMDNIVRSQGSDGLSPALAPYFSVNLMANRLSREVESRGMATTVTMPHTGLADAFASASNALAAGRVDRALIACTEVASPDGAFIGYEGEGCVSYLLSSEPADDAMEVSIMRGFADPGRPPWRLGMMPNIGMVGDTHSQSSEVVVFTDLPVADSRLHAILDLNGECIDARVLPLTRGMIAQASTIASLVEQRKAATVFTVCASGQWSRIGLLPVARVTR